MGDSQNNARRPVVAERTPEAARGSTGAISARSYSDEQPQELIGRADQVVIVSPRTTVLRSKVSK